MSLKVLFLVNGLGFGNSTRCEAIIDILESSGANVRVVTSGNGLWYFKDRRETIEIDAFRYASKNNRLSILGTLAAGREIYGIAARNNEIIRQVVRDYQPDVAVCDSVYCQGTLRKMGVPVVAINNADVVVDAMKSAKDIPRSVYPQYYCIEFADYLYHKTVPDLVVSPSFDPSVPLRSKNTKRTNPIIRRDMLPGSPPVSYPKRVLVMLSGSSFGSPVVFRAKNFPFRIDIVGRAKPEGVEIPDNVRYHGRLRDNRHIVTEADLAIVNGGFSAISEMFCLRKPMVVVPIPNHSEQWCNGWTIQRLGVGLSIDEQDLEKSIFDAAERLEHFYANYDKVAAQPNGAQQAADHIIHLVNP